MSVRPANCSYLHSAFGPGCPYCHPVRAARAPDAAASSGPVADDPDPAPDGQPSSVTVTR